MRRYMKQYRDYLESQHKEDIEIKNVRIKVLSEKIDELYNIVMQQVELELKREKELATEIGYSQLPEGYELPTPRIVRLNNWIRKKFGVL